MAKVVFITKVGGATSVIVEDDSVVVYSYVFSNAKDLSVTTDGRFISISDNALQTNPYLSFKFSELDDDLGATDAYGYIQAAAAAGLFVEGVGSGGSVGDATAANQALIISAIEADGDFAQQEISDDDSVTLIADTYQEIDASITGGTGTISIAGNAITYNSTDAIIGVSLKNTTGISQEVIVTVPAGVENTALILTKTV